MKKRIKQNLARRKVLIIHPDYGFCRNLSSTLNDQDRFDVHCFTQINHIQRIPANLKIDLLLISSDLLQKKVHPTVSKILSANQSKITVIAKDSTKIINHQEFVYTNRFDLKKDLVNFIDQQLQQ